jgi:histidinol-phosphate aminotransferase
MTTARRADTTRLLEWIRPEIRALSAYHVPDAADLIKLDAMENPYPWPGELVDDWLQVLRSTSLNRYPDPDAQRLKQRLRTAMAIPAGRDLLLGNGSDELIQMILMALAGSGRCVLAPAPSFSMYKMIATFVGVDCVEVPLDVGDFSLDMPAMLAAIERHQPAVVFIAYPNNPTGNLFSREDICRVIESAPGFVVVDEAYHAFASDSFFSHLDRYENLLVLRTLSKMGLAGLRLGLMVGSRDVLAEFNKIRLPYNINSLSQASAEFALAHHVLLEQQTAKIVEDRETLLQQLDVMLGVEAFPSDANFILFRVPAGQAQPVFDGLKERGVLIKNMHGSSPLLEDCLRVTVGTPMENVAFVEALATLL